MDAFKAQVARYDTGHLRALILLSVLSNTMVLAPSFHMLQIYDRVLSSGSLATLVYLTIIVLFALCVYGFAETMRLRVAQRLSARYAVINTQKVFSRLAQGTSPSDAAKSMRDFATVRSYLGNRAFASLFDVPFIPLFVVLLFIIHWSVGVVTLLGIGAMVFAAVLNSSRTAVARSAFLKADAEATAFAQAAFLRGEDVRSMGLLPAFISEWSTKSSSAMQASEAMSTEASFYYSVGKVVRQSLQVLIMAWGAFLVVSGNMSGGLIFMASMMSGKALGPIEMLIGGWDGFSKFLVAFREIETLLGEDRSLRTRPSLQKAKGHLRCENISFSAENSADRRPLLEDITLSVAPGELLIVTGPAASGKTILAKILAGAIQPSKGVLRLDGAALDQWPTAQWGAAVGYVAQEAEFFPGTIAANIARFSEGISPEDVYAAALKAGVHEHILHLPKGYQTVIGTGTFALPSSLSQGVALARAFYGDPRCLILDQPSAHLDQVGEEAMVETLKTLKAEGVSIIVVSRRNVLFAMADRVVVMRDGRIATVKQNQPAGAENERAAVRVSIPTTKRAEAPAPTPLPTPLATPLPTPLATPAAAPARSETAAALQARLQRSRLSGRA
jgi:PrtD family type I secretion system ABC transporter